MSVDELSITGLTAESWIQNEQSAGKSELEKILYGSRGTELRKILQLFDRYENLVGYLLSELETRPSSISEDELKDGFDLDIHLDNIQRSILIKFMEFYDNNVPQISIKLNVKRTTVHERLKRLGLKNGK